MAAPYPIRHGEQDCRDFLRTGRCKYGESCKYNHPLNVETGGGFKPTNPGEPLFPVRPMEPTCQYFLKHGTCKFGQACKFNHPSGSPLAGDVCMPAGQLVFVTSNQNNGVTGTSSSSLMQAASSNSAVQVLPQRPTEPNCIYFLRNGKCKYGATCKFHHPLDAINNNKNLIQQTAANNERDRSYSISSSGSLERTQQMMQQQNISYAHVANNVTYVQQQQRLQAITERARPQQATHILLPDGQIAVILDSQSLQNVSELNAQDRPKFYQSQNGSIGTLPSIDHPPQQVVIQSPMLTATTGSTSNHTFDSSIGDLMGTNVSYQVQGQIQETSRSRGGQHGSGGSLSARGGQYGSGGSLSAYGSVDSGSQGGYTPVTGNMYHQQQSMSTNNGQSYQSTSLQPQFSAWPLNESLSQTSNNQQAHARRPPSSAEAHDRQQRQAEDAAASYFWPSNGSFSSIPVNETEQQQAGQNYMRRTNSSPTVGAQPMHQSQSYERRGTLSPSENSRRTQESSGDDQASLSMMTSALLTMMDPPSSNGELAHHQQHPQSSLRRAVHQNEVYTTTKSDPNIQDSPMRPPPGMSPPGMANGGSNSASPRRSNGHSGYFVGGY